MLGRGTSKHNDKIKVVYIMTFSVIDKHVLPVSSYIHLYHNANAVFKPTDCVLYLNLNDVKAITKKSWHISCVLPGLATLLLFEYRLVTSKLSASNKGTI